MSEIPNDHDPYAAPQDTTPQVATSGLSAGLKTVAIIAIVLGGFGIASALMGTVGLVLNRQVQSMFGAGGAAGQGGDAARFQQQLQKRLAETTHKYMVMSLVALVSKVFVAALLLGGGILILMVRPVGRRILRIGSGVAILYELAAAGLNIVVQLANMRIVREVMADGFRGMPGGQGGPPPDSLANIMTIAMMVGIAFTLAFTLVKIIFYAFTCLYLGRASVHAQLQEGTPPA